MRQFILLLGLLCLAAAGPTPGSKNVHDLMTDEEIMQVFQTKRHAVPEYEVVPVHWPKKSKRSSGSPTPLQLDAFGTSIKLWLHPTDDVLVGRNTPVYMAEFDAGRFQMNKVEDPMARVGEMLEDRERQATLMVKKTEQGSNTITGSVGEQGWNVKPLPDHINRNYGGRLPPKPNRNNQNNGVRFPFSPNDINRNNFGKFPLWPNDNNRNDIGRRPHSIYDINKIFDDEISSIFDQINGHRAINVKRSANTMEYPQNSITEHSEPHYHVIYKQPQQNRTADYTFIPMKEGLLDEQLNRSKRMAVPEVIYPQVLIFVDVGTYRLHDENLSKLLEYLLPFWNGVDLRYRSLKDPKVRFNIAGIIIGMDHYVFPFISRHLTSWNNLYVDDVPKDLSNFLFEKSTIKQIFPSQSYDIAIAMVPYKMCTRRDSSCMTLGLAFVGGACTRDRTGVIHDNGNFNGIDTAVHEVGHLFGVNHDSELSSATCADEGYIMASHSQQTKNVANWSNCSVESMQKFFRGQAQQHWTPVCLYNKPNPKYLLPRVLPGSIMTRDEQCKKQFGTRHCDTGHTEEELCLSLFCLESDYTNMCRSVMSPVDGTICGTNKICLKAKCVDQSLIL